jgi:hypothetical protein
MDLGHEQGIPVITRPLSPEESQLRLTGRCIEIIPKSDEGISGFQPTLVKGYLGGTIVYLNNVTTMLPRFEKRLEKVRTKAAKRILAHYACTEETPSA